MKSFGVMKHMKENILDTLSLSFSYLQIFVWSTVDIEIDVESQVDV
jgi:hypothetical protein